MMRRIQCAIAVFLSLVFLLLLADVFYLAYYFPKTMAEWAEQGRHLAGLQQLACNLSGLCQQFVLVLVPVFAFGAIGCITWALRTSRPLPPATLDRTPQQFSQN